MDTKKKKNTQSKDKIRNPIRRGLEAVRLGAGGCGLRAPCDASCAAVPASTIPGGPSRYFHNILIWYFLWHFKKKYTNAISRKRSCEKQYMRWIVFCCKLYQTFVKIIKWSYFYILGFCHCILLECHFLCRWWQSFLLDPSPIIALPCHSVSKSSFWVFLRLLDLFEVVTWICQN